MAINKSLDILLGDDGFTSVGSIKSDLLLTFVSLWKNSGKSQEKPITISREENLYTCEYAPLEDFSQINVRVVPTVEEMIEESIKGNYDWIVTDMNYGSGREMGCVQVINSIPEEVRDKAITAVWTNEDNPRMRSTLDELEIDYIISPKLAGYSGTKAELFGKTIAEHYFHRDERGYE